MESSFDSRRTRYATASRSLSWLLLLIAIAIGLLDSGSAQSPSSADNAMSAAGFIVDTGEGEPIYVVVTYANGTMSAIDLLERTDLPIVTVDFGGLGRAVCSIETTGCDVADCRRRLCQTGDPESPFWQFWRQDEADSWSLAQRGASQSRVSDGSIDAWVWTGAEPSLPDLDWTLLAERAGAPKDVVSGSIDGAPEVYMSALHQPDAGRPVEATIAAFGTVVILGGVGGWLVVRHRQAQRSGS